MLQRPFFFSCLSYAQWLPQHPGFTRDTVGFYEMSLPDKNTTWAVCYDGWGGLLSGKPMLKFTRTLDGGATWIPGQVGTDKTLRFSNISAIDGQEAWVAMHKMDYTTIPTLQYVGFGKGGGIFHTVDGGVSWEHTAPGELFDLHSTPQFVYFKDKNHGIAMGDPNGGFWEIYLTNNKGKKWKRVPTENLPAPLDNEKGWISGYAAIGHTIWFGTSAGRMYKSIDFGKTWTVHTVDPLPGTAVNEIAFLDDGLHGIAHLRGRNRTFVFSTADGGLTWTNYFQPPNWKNSRVTAVPGTQAFISTAVHNPFFRGSAISYDAGKTWTEIEKDASKAVCRFFDPTTGYAGSFYQTGHPVFGVGGIFKSQILFQSLPLADNKSRATKNGNSESIMSVPGKALKVYPTPAKDVVHLILPDEMVKARTVISIVSMDGKVMAALTSANALSIQLPVSRLPAGTYMLRVQSEKHTINRLILLTK